MSANGLGTRRDRGNPQLCGRQSDSRRRRGGEGYYQVLRKVSSLVGSYLRFSGIVWAADYALFTGREYKNFAKKCLCTH